MKATTGSVAVLVVLAMARAVEACSATSCIDHATKYRDTMSTARDVAREVLDKEGVKEPDKEIGIYESDMMVEATHGTPLEAATGALIIELAYAQSNWSVGTFTDEVSTEVNKYTKSEMQQLLDAPSPGKGGAHAPMATARKHMVYHAMQFVDGTNTAGTTNELATGAGSIWDQRRAMEKKGEYANMFGYNSTLTAPSGPVAQPAPATPAPSVQTPPIAAPVPVPPAPAPVTAIDHAG